MDNVELVDVLYSTDNLLKDSASLFLIEPFLFNDVVEEFSVLHVLHDEEKLFRSLYDFVELYDIGVADEF